MIPYITLQAMGASPQWWLVGWVGSVALLAVGYLIAAVYYDGDESVATNDSRDRGESA